VPLAERVLSNEARCWHANKQLLLQLRDNLGSLRAGSCLC
jgi:hypothetical protein